MRSRLLAFALVAFAAARPAVAQTSTDNLPHAFPRDGAKQIFDNPWGTAWEATWTPHKVLPLHRHRYDYLVTELESSTFNVYSATGQKREGSRSKGDAYFLPKGVTHAEEGVSGNPPRHAVIIDLKDTTTTAIANTTKFPTAFKTPIAKFVADNPRVTIWDRTWTPGDSATAVFYDRGAFLVVIDGGDLAVSSGNAAATVRHMTPGQVLFIPAGETRAERATSGTVHAAVFVLK